MFSRKIKFNNTLICQCNIKIQNITPIGLKWDILYHQVWGWLAITSHFQNVPFWHHRWACPPNLFPLFNTPLPWWLLTRIDHIFKSRIRHIKKNINVYFGAHFHSWLILMVCLIAYGIGPTYNSNATHETNAKHHGPHFPAQAFS